MLMDRTGIGGGQHVTMHTARRTFITNLADFGVPIESIKKLAGHSKITTTSKYMQLSTGMVQRELERAFCKDCTKITHIDIHRQVIKVSPTGKPLVAGGEILRCINCSFYKGYRCRLFHKKKNADDWCESFVERLDGEPGANLGKKKKKAA